MRLDRECEDVCGEPWDVLGWINLQPGQNQSRDNATGNRWFYYYAEAADGAVWNGPVPAEVSNARFENAPALV
jgi:uncharacterized membrane protein